MISLNSTSQLIFEMEKCCVFVAVGTESLNIIWVSFNFKSFNDVCIL
jgi:hypothetical protein